jgi:type III secretion system YscD/HrpQ family protein
MTTYLIVQEGSLKGESFELNERESWILGRDPDLAQIVIEDPTVSREHIRLIKTGSKINIENLSDTSVALLNGRQLTETTPLNPGDLISVGEQTLRFEADDTNERYQQEPYELKPTEEAMNPSENVKEAPEEEKHDTIFGEEKAEALPNKGLAKINFDLLDSGRFLLKVIGGPNNGAEFSMKSGHTYILGTDPNSCDIVFHDTSVSRQHARVYINDENAISIEDLKSRNGTLVDGKAIEGKTPLGGNSVVTVGTTSFVVYDREGNMQTIISPLLPEIVKVLQKEDIDSQEKPASVMQTQFPPAPSKERPLGAFIMIAIITGLFVLIAMGVTSLFRSEPVENVAAAEIDTELQNSMAAFPDIKYSFNKSTGRLLLVGHVLTGSDKNQLLYNLQGLNFIKSLDDSAVVIDELVWQNTNEFLNRNPAWRGISVQSPKAGQYILTGYLQNNKQAEGLYDYISANFPYLDKLERQVVIEEDVVNQVTSLLAQHDIRSVNVQFQNGEIVLTGGVPAQKQDIYSDIQTEIKKIPGVRQVRSQVTNLITDSSTINISDRYEVSGYSRQGAKISIMINGRIVSKGDSIDGMLIKSISPNSILLDKDGVNYRIDYSK